MLLQKNAEKEQIERTVYVGNLVIQVILRLIIYRRLMRISWSKYLKHVVLLI